MKTLRNIWPFRRRFPRTNLITYSSLDLSLSKSSVRMPEDPNSCNLVIALCRTFSSSFEVGGSFSIPKSKRMRYRDTFNWETSEGPKYNTCLAFSEGELMICRNVLSILTFLSLCTDLTPQPYLLSLITASIIQVYKVQFIYLVRSKISTILWLVNMIKEIVRINTRDYMVISNIIFIIIVFIVAYCRIISLSGREGLWFSSSISISQYHVPVSLI